MISSRTYKYCCEDISNIENYDKAVADTKRVWQCHHRREIQDGITIWTPAELKKVGQYYNRPANELILLTCNEHKRIHNLNMSDATRNKLATALANRNYSRVYTTASEATRKKMSIARKGQLTGSKNGMFGKCWYNNGKINVVATECPEGFVKGKLHGKKV